MNIPCPDKIDCACDVTPFANLSAEAPDVEGFFSLQRVKLTPPLGYEWGQLTCLQLCENEPTQELADLCAYEQAFFCVTGTWTLPGFGDAQFAVPPPITPVGDGRPPQFKSRQATATVNCPDGLPFSFTIPGGLFPGNNQQDADARAQSYAQQKANERLICLSGLPSPICVNAEFNGVITASGKFVAPSGNIWDIVAGSVPPGLDFDSNGGPTATLTGTPTVPGIYHFTVQVIEPIGDFMQKPYTLSVAGITNGNLLPDGTIGQAYNQDVNSAGVVNPIYSLESGSLPDGLQLDSGGIIFGTPTKNGDFDFKLGVTEAGTGITCISDASIHVGGCGPVPTDDWAVITDKSVSTEVGYVDMAVRTGSTPMVVLISPNIPPGGQFGLFTIRMNGQATNSVASTANGNIVSVGYCPLNDVFVVPTTSDIYNVNPDTLAIISDLPAATGTVTSPIFSASTGFMYFCSPDGTLWVYNAVTGAMVTNSVPIPNCTAVAPRPSIDEANQILYLARNDAGGGAFVSGFDISVNPPVLVVDRQIPTLGGDPSGVAGCVFADSNGFVYVEAIGQGGGQVIPYDPDNDVFLTPVNVTNNSTAILMTFDPASNLVFVPDVTVVRVICTISNLEIGQIAVSALSVIFHPTTSSVLLLNTDLNLNETVIDYK